MTMLFNLFCSLLFYLNLKISVFIMIMISYFLFKTTISWVNVNMFSVLFGMAKNILLVIFSFLMLLFMNLISLMIFNYPVSTTLSFNLSLALILWTSSIIFGFYKPKMASSLLPLNSPWYLISFLCLVELVSLMVRPITLCFRLLANMSAGHILLTLICKMPFSLWGLGVLFGLLELMVSMVQAFVFLMLALVYLEESISH